MDDFTRSAWRSLGWNWPLNHLARTSSWAFGHAWVGQWPCARTSSWSFRYGWIRHWLCTRAPSSFWYDPRRWRNFVLQQFTDTPDMIRESCRHSGSAFPPTRLPRLIAETLAELIMWPTPVVGAAQQIHPRLQPLQATSRMAAFARQRREPLAYRSIQSFNEGRIKNTSSARAVQENLGLL